jgi:hypothetical protein
MTQEQNREQEIFNKIDLLLKSKEGGHICYSTWFASETLNRECSAIMFLEAATLRLLACDEVCVDVTRYFRDSVLGMTEATMRVSLNKIEDVSTPYNAKIPPPSQDVELCHMLAEHLQVEARRIVEKFAAKSS